MTNSVKLTKTRTEKNNYLTSYSVQVSVDYEKFKYILVLGFCCVVHTDYKIKI